MIKIACGVVVVFAFPITYVKNHFAHLLKGINFVILGVNVFTDLSHM